jgi:hypothetical protein
MPNDAIERLDVGWCTSARKPQPVPLRSARASKGALRKDPASGPPERPSSVDASAPDELEGPLVAAGFARA